MNHAEEIQAHPYYVYFSHILEPVETTARAYYPGAVGITRKIFGISEAHWKLRKFSLLEILQKKFKCYLRADFTLRAEQSEVLEALAALLPQPIAEEIRVCLYGEIAAELSKK